MQHKITRIAFLLFCFLPAAFITHAQDRYTVLEIRLDTSVTKSGRKLTVDGREEKIRFALPGQVTMMDPSGLLTIDSQLVQVTLLQMDSAVAGTGEQQALRAYSKYELDYLEADMKIPLINPQNQWVTTKSGRGWLVWYFRVGKLPLPVQFPVEVQLYASTLIGDKVLTINAPIMEKGNFGKAAMIVNGLMESMERPLK